LTILLEEERKKVEDLQFRFHNFFFWNGTEFHVGARCIFWTTSNTIAAHKEAGQECDF
jgi:hypothetical protein